MIDQEMNLPVRDRTAPHNDGIRQATAAIISITRREWMAQRLAPAAPDEVAANRARYAHPLIRFALDAKRISVWRARAERQGVARSRRAVGKLGSHGLETLLPRNQATAALKAEQRIVNIQGQTMLPATPQRTACRSLDAAAARGDHSPASWPSSVSCAERGRVPRGFLRS